MPVWGLAILMNINMINRFKKPAFLTAMFFCLTPLTACAKSVDQVRPAPISGFVQIIKQTAIIECKEGTACKQGIFSSVGSGGVIGKHNGITAILTAAHVCSDSIGEADPMISKKETRLLVRIWDNSEVPGFILYISESKEADLCAIYIATPSIDMEILKVSDIKPVPGQKVLSMAAPAGIYHPPTVPILQGRYSGPLPDKINGIVTIPAKPGASGALILTEEYKIVGSIFAVSINFEHVTLIVDYDITKLFIKKSLEILKETNSSQPAMPRLHPVLQQ